VNWTAYHNYLAFIELWSEIKDTGVDIPTSLADPGRPQGIALLFDNTTVAGNWVEVQDVKDLSLKYNRIINNVSLAMPHAGIFGAAHDPKNNILQPSELAGVGEFNIRAAIPSPTVNVICANMDKDELAPLVYTSWPYANTTSSDIPNQRLAWSGWQAEVPQFSATEWLNKTVVDDVFQWGEQYDRRPPVFPMVSAYCVQFRSNC
jgi:hypothetical protein